MHDQHHAHSRQAALPSMIEVGGTLAPESPATIDDTGLDRSVLLDLALRAAYVDPHFTTERAAGRLHLPIHLLHELLEQLKDDRLLQALGELRPFNHRYMITEPGRERARRLYEVSGYVGPAPVSLDAYAAMLDHQIARFVTPTPQRIAAALAGLVLPPEAVHVAQLAVMAQRSLYISGPPGNGKTSLGRLLHNALEGELYVPYAIGIGEQVIRVYDPECHQAVPLDDARARFDRRWVRIRRPMVVMGGELTIEALDLGYSQATREYEAPLHVKSNGGTLLIDDFGRQRVDPHELLNRWIIPLEHQVDYLSLRVGHKLQIPFQQMLILATNIPASELTMDPAFLRRMGYRVHLGAPTPQRYAEVFQRYAASKGLEAPAALVDRLLARYRVEGRELRACEPRDLIERVGDVCRLEGRPTELNEANLDLAWAGYFGVAPQWSQDS